MSRTLALLFVLSSPALLAAESPRVVSLQTQRHGDTTYFVVTVHPPEDLWMTAVEASDLSASYESARRRLARLPQLIPQDEHTSAVYSGLNLPLAAGRDLTLRFVGKASGKKKAKLLLVYPTRKKDSGRKKSSLIRRCPPRRGQKPP